MILYVDLLNVLRRQLFVITFRLEYDIQIYKYAENFSITSIRYFPLQNIK